jgi:hypothetical protein
VNIRKYIERKYPKSYNKLFELFSDQCLSDYVRGRKYFPVFLEKEMQGYSVGTLCLMKRYKDRDSEGVWTSQFTVEFVSNCDSNKDKINTYSGYHSWGGYYYVEHTRIEE